MMQVLKARLPDLKAVLPVYAVLVFVLYGWMTITFFWKMPAWLFYLNLGEIGIIYSYGIVNEFVESVVYIFLVLMLAAALPPSFLRDRFQTRGTLIVVFLLGVVYLMSYLIAFQEVDRLKAALFALMIFGILNVILLWVSAKFSFVNRVIVFVTDQMTIFLYIYAPITAISFLVILFRMTG